LEPEESDNYSVGLVIEPIPTVTFTLDFWSIEKERTIGLFGEENHTLLDLVGRLENGLNNCAAFQGNPAVVRDSDIEADAAAIYTAAGICPAGDIDFVSDQYANLDTRTVRGHDIGIYWDLETQFGDFVLNYNASFLDKFEQEAGGQAAVLVEAQESGLLPANFPVAGFRDLEGVDGNIDEKHSARLNWRNGNWGAAVSGLRVGDFIQSSLTLSDGTEYKIPSMTTYNASADYRFEWNDINVRTRVGINNVTDERAPLADRFFGYYADVHRDLGRYYFVELRFSADG
ncbi:MAG: TonB-dependent receptor, partial [Pseudomonadota bacterium]